MTNKILMILQSEFPPDIRLEKEIKSLSNAGFQVLVVCNQYDKKLNPEFKLCDIQRVKALFNSVRLNKIVNLPIFFNPRFLFVVLKATITFKPSFVHTHDLPMMPIGILISKITRIPVVFDMHENYPEALRAFQKKGIFNYIFKNYKAARILEKICIKLSDVILTVVYENSERLIKQGVDPKQIYLVSNTVDLNTFGREPFDNDVTSKYKNNTILLYSGYVTPERGLDTVVKGMNLLKEKVAGIKLLIVGNGISIPHLRDIVSTLCLNNYVEFIEWPGHDKLSSYFKVAAICISPQPKCVFWNTTVPHKLFEYMSQSKPVLAADSKAIRRIIAETNSGMTYETDNHEDFANRVIQILSSNITFGDNGYRAILKTYNWKNDSNTLIKMYKDLAGQIK